MVRLRAIFRVLTLGLVAWLPGSAAAQSPGADQRDWMYRQYLRLDRYVRGGTVEPRWLSDGRRFWFVEHGADEAPVYLVDPAKGIRRHLFDLSSLQKGLQRILEEGTPAEGLPFSDLQLKKEDEELVELTVGRHKIELDTRSEELRVLPEPTPPPIRPRWNEVVSPDGAWAARIEHHNVWLRSLRDGSEEPLTTDGTPDQPWGGPEDRGPQILWDPDGSKLAVTRLDLQAVPKIPIVSYLTEQPELQWVHLWEAKGPFETTELFILGVETKESVRVKPDAVTELPDRLYLLGWLPDGSEILFAQLTRDFRTLRVSAANSETGALRTLIREERETFFHIPGYRPLTATMLNETDQFLWRSDRDGWHHLYLYDLRGKLLRQLTDGPFEVVEVVGVDEEDGWVYFTAHSDPTHPYDTHLCRVSLQGGEVRQLTEGRGMHRAVLSPQKGFFIDTYTNVNPLAVVELRTADGEFVDTLSVAELHTPKGFRWVEPEEFVVKAADGETDLHGVLYKPYDFDPGKRYPVIEIMVGRPTVAVNEMIRTHTPRTTALAQLGFVVVALDGRGTPERGHAFHAVIYGAMGRYEIPDHVAALNQLFEERPYMDRGRVGVTGGSYGGYYTIRALLQAPDVYHVGIAWAPYDPRGDAVLAYMGLPQQNPQGYEYASNRWMADQLKGHLMIQHGSADAGAYLFWTMQFVEALIQAGKPVDLLVLPDEGHGFRGESAAYAHDALRRYLQDHLQAGRTGGAR